MTAARRYETVAEIREANRAAGHHFFDRATMEFFRSKVLPGVYGGRFFVTEELTAAVEGESLGGVAVYTVRFCSNAGEVFTASPVKHGNRTSARAHAGRLAREFTEQYGGAK